jgi:hypothetical protein
MRLSLLIRNTKLHGFAANQYRDNEWHWDMFADWLLTNNHRGFGATLGEIPVPELANPNPILPLRKFRCGHLRTTGNTVQGNCVLCVLQWGIEHQRLDLETAQAIRGRLRI